MSKRQTKKTPARRKHTIILTTETSMRLGIEAQRRGVDRSATTEAILADGLRHIVISIRGQSGETDPPAQTGPALTVRTG
jgi:hypothetical protein